MKAKYYSDCTVLEAPLGSKPSFAWRSIQGSCDLLREGLVWRVGNGKSIRIWKDRWISSPTTYRVQSPPRVLDETATVSSLIDTNTKWWNYALLEQIFSREDLQAIQSIPLSATDQADALIWRGTAKGIFTVRSAYHIQKECEMVNKAESSMCWKRSPIWNKIWQLQIPNTEKHFIWRAVHEILPTRENLCSRKVLTDPNCPICGRAVETTFHALWQCPAAQDVWSAGGVIFQKSYFDGPAFIQVVDGMMDRCNDLNLALFVGISRRIWLRRNEVIFGGGFFAHPNTIVQQAGQAEENFREVIAGDTHQFPFMEATARITWKAPPTDCLKVNWDAGIDRKKGRVGLGVIIRDHLGRVWASKSQTRRGFLDPTTAETMAALLAIQLCCEMGIQRVQLEGDAKNVITAVNSGEPDGSSRGQITEDIREMLKGVPWWEMNYVSRDQNKVAHKLAALAVADDLNRVWFYTHPDCIRDLLQADLSVLPSVL
jgi:ribonuclease HI